MEASNEGLKNAIIAKAKKKKNVGKKKEVTSFDKCFYYLINGESTEFRNCFIRRLEISPSITRRSLLTIFFSPPPPLPLPSRHPTTSHV